MKRRYISCTVRAYAHLIDICRFTNRPLVTSVRRCTLCDYRLQASLDCNEMSTCELLKQRFPIRHLYSTLPLAVFYASYVRKIDYCLLKHQASHSPDVLLCAKPRGLSSPARPFLSHHPYHQQHGQQDTSARPTSPSRWEQHQYPRADSPS